MIKKIFSRFFSSRRPFKLSPAGWVFILYTIGVGAGAINTGNNLLYLVFGVFLGLILASGLLSDLSLWSVEVNCEFPPFIVANQSNILTFELINHKKRFSSFAVNVELEGRLGNEKIRLKAQVPYISPEESIRAHFSFRPPSRGWFQIDHIRLTTLYPFGLLKKWWTWNEKDLSHLGMFVYPSTFPVDLTMFQNFRAGYEQSAGRPERGEGAVIYGLREFRTSDNPRRIHWKASAKQAAVDTENPGLLIREMEKDHELDMAIQLPTPELARKKLDSEDAEWLVRCAASLLEAYKNAGLKGRLMVNWKQGEDFFREIESDDDLESAMRFLSLWDPLSYPEAPLESFLREDARLEGDRISMDLIEAYREWKASGPRMVV